MNTSPKYLILIAIILLLLSGLVAIWYGISAGLLVAVWPIYYLGMIAKELESIRTTNRKD